MGLCTGQDRKVVGAGACGICGGAAAHGDREAVQADAAAALQGLPPGAGQAVRERVQAEREEWVLWQFLSSKRRMHERTAATRRFICCWPLLRGSVRALLFMRWR